jgi:hypothetical protein
MLEDSSAVADDGRNDLLVRQPSPKKSPWCRMARIAFFPLFDVVVSFTFPLRIKNSESDLSPWQ